MIDTYISESQRKHIICRLSDGTLKRLSDEQIVDMCPLDYGSSVTDDHRLYIWNSAYDEFEKLSDTDLLIREELYFNNNNRDLSNGVLNQLLFNTKDIK